MKKFVKYVFLFLACPIFGQTVVFTSGVNYTSGAPTHNPGKANSRIAIDTVTWLRYEHVVGTTWTTTGYAWQEHSGCSAPSGAPTKHQSIYKTNTCAPPKMYKWTGAVWEEMGGGTVTGGENGIYLSGTKNRAGGPLIENTNINGKATYTLTLDSMYLATIKANRTGGTGASRMTMGSTNLIGVDIVHYNTADLDNIGQITANFNTGNIMSLANGSLITSFTQYLSGGTYRSEWYASNGVINRIMGLGHDYFSIQYLDRQGAAEETGFMMWDTISGKTYYQSPDIFASIFADDWGSQTVSTTARFSGNGTSGSPLELANGTTGSFLRSGASVPAWETAASLQGSLLLPSGTSGQTLVNNGSGAWLASSNIYNNGTNVGIGTSSPSEKLSIAGSLYLSDLLWMSSNRGVVSVGNIFSNGLPDDFLFRAVGGNLRFGTSAYASMSIMTDGRIGFGDASTSPTYDLQLARSTGTIMAIESQASGSVATPAQTALLFVGGSSSKTAKICGIDRLANVGYGGLSFYVPSNVASSVSSMEERIRIDGTGDANFYCSIAPNGNAGASGHVYVSGGANTYGSYSSPSAIVLAGNGLQVSGTPTAGQTLRYNSSGAWVTNSILYNDGTSVGIGTTSPSGKLNIVTTNTADNLKLDSNSGGVTGATFLNDNTVKGYFAITRAADQFFTGSTSDDMVFRSESDNIHFGVGSGAPGISIVSNNTGIGTTSPAQKLDVNGTVRIVGSSGTATGLMGRDADGDVSGVGLSVGLEFSGSNIQVDVGSGLNVSGNSIAWGGALTENTTVDFDTYDVYFTDMPTSTTEDEALVIDSGTGKLARGTIPITAIRAPGEATYLGANGATGETVTWQPEDVNVDADPTAGHLTVELNGGMYTGVHYSLFGCCNLTYNIILSGTMKLTGEYGTVASYTLTAGQHLEVVKFSDNSFRVSKK